jgi:hypothetical protein
MRCNANQATKNIQKNSVRVTDREGIEEDKEGNRRGRTRVGRNDDEVRRFKLSVSS